MSTIGDGGIPLDGPGWVAYMRSALGAGPEEGASDLGSLPLEALMPSAGAGLREQLAAADEPALRSLLHRVTERLDAIEVDAAALAALHGRRGAPSQAAEAEQGGASVATQRPSRQAQAQAGARHAELRQLELLQQGIQARLAALPGGQGGAPHSAFDAQLWDWRSQQQAIAEAYVTLVELDEAQQGLIMRDPVTAATDLQSSERVAASFGHVNDMLNRAERAGLARGTAAIGAALAVAIDRPELHTLLEAADALVQVADCYAEAGGHTPAVDRHMHTVVDRFTPTLQTAIPDEQRRLAFLHRTDDAAAFHRDAHALTNALMSAQPPLARSVQIAALNALAAFTDAHEHYADALQAGLAPLPNGQPLSAALASLHSADGSILPVDFALMQHLADYRKHLRQGDRELTYACRQAAVFHSLMAKVDHPSMADLARSSPTMANVFELASTDDAEDASEPAADPFLLADLAPRLDGYAPFLLQPHPYVAVSIDVRVAAMLRPEADRRHFVGEAGVGQA